MNILYLGASSGISTVPARADALRRLGHEVVAVDPRKALPSLLLVDWWCFHHAGWGFEPLVARYVLGQAGRGPYDIAFVDVGELVGARLVRKLRQVARTIVCFNQDNPFTARDGNRWRLFLDALPEYDLVAFPRESSAEIARRRGARRVLRIWHPADERFARSVELTAENRARYAAEVSFVGTWMPERGPFLARLIELGVPLRIFGPKWHKAPELPVIADRLAPGPLAREDYVAVLAAAKICLALLSKGNEDLHTTRSTEIPALGRVLCGERTADHLAMYREDEEAVFFDTPEECAEKCLALLADPARLERIAAAGHRRALANGIFSEPQLKRILDAASNQDDGA